MNKLGIGCGILGVVGAIVLLFFLAGVFSYNHLVNLSQGVDQQWAQVQNNYQRRADLIPNLVNTVSGAANFEKSTLLAVTQARASVGQVRVDPNIAPADPKQLVEYQSAQNQLGTALSRLLVVSERYPELRATQQFGDLSAELAGTENRIAVARMDFNNAVKAYNSAIKSVPGVFFAGMLGYKEKPYFQATAGSETPPKVQFDFSNQKTAPATN
jgi:LemA protein